MFRIWLQQNYESRKEEKNRRELAEMYEDTAEKFDWLQLHMNTTHEPNTRERGKKVLHPFSPPPKQMHTYKQTGYKILSYETHAHQI